jgi:uncharacterized membrane protein HdeD (DUF308 family)
MNATSVGTIAKRAVEWSIGISILMILMGTIATVIPAAGATAVVPAIGSLLVFGGIAYLVFGWDMRTAGGFAWEVFLGVLYILVGAYLFFHIASALKVVTVAIGVYLLVEAILEFVLSYRLRPLTGSGWLAFDGVFTAILAVLIWRVWATPWAIGVLVGLSILVSGISRLVLSLAARPLAAKLP